MKLKKGIALFLIFVFLMLQLNFIQFLNVSQAQETQTFNFELHTSDEKVTKGSKFTITTRAKDLADLSSGIIAIGGQLEFDKDLLEIDAEPESVKGLGSWKFSKGYYNLNNFKFITDSDEVVTEDGNVFSITFKVKEDVEPQETEISLKSIVAGTGELVNGIARSQDSSITITIEDEKEPEYITSTEYDISEENKTISEIPADTTIATFKSNVSTNATMVFSDKDGNTIEDDSTVLENGMKLNVGETLEFTLVVKEREVVEDITSTVYTIDKENNTVSEIPADTTIATFKSNVETNATLVFVDKDGNTIESDAVVLENGMKLKVGTTYEFTLVVKEREVEEEYIRSTVYDISEEDKTISEISVNTKISDFISNVETNTTLVFLDKNGNVVTDETQLVKTGMKLKVGTTYEFTLIVKGDADGDGLVTVNDIALMKLHYIEKPGYSLRGINLKAVDVDNDERISVNDVAQIKLLWIKIK